MNRHARPPETPRPTLEDDLAFLRRVAEQGQRTAVISGAYMILWGMLIAAAYSVHYAVIAEILPREGWIIGTAYGAMTLFGWAGSVGIGFVQQRSPGPQAVGTRIYAAVFISAGLAITLFSAGASLTPVIPSYTTMIVGALMMGLCFLVTGTLSQMLWLSAVGVIWFVAGTGLFALAGQKIMLAVGAGIWLVLLAGPGAILAARNHRQGRMRLQAQFGTS